MDYFRDKSSVVSPARSSHLLEEAIPSEEAAPSDFPEASASTSMSSCDSPVNLNYSPNSRSVPACIFRLHRNVSVPQKFKDYYFM